METLRGESDSLLDATSVNHRQVRQTHDLKTKVMSVGSSDAVYPSGATAASGADASGTFPEDPGEFEKQFFAEDVLDCHVMNLFVGIDAEVDDLIDEAPTERIRSVV